MTTPDATTRDAQVTALKHEIESLQRTAMGLRTRPKTVQEQWEADMKAAGTSKADIDAETRRLILWTSQMRALEDEKKKLEAEIARLSA
jgi:hypothetical protein